MNLRQALSVASRHALRCLPFAIALAVVALPAFGLQEGQEAPKGGGQISIGKVIVDSGFIGWVICALSVVALAVIIELFVSMKRDKLAPPDLVDEVHSLFDEEQFQEAIELCESEQNFFTRVTAAGIAKIGHGFEVIEKSIEEMGDEEAVKLHQRIGWLSVIANVGPMLGLLGTVQGMIGAFAKIEETSGQADPGQLAGNISIALLTTLFGLLVAIPTTAAFAYLRNHLIKSVIEVGAIVEDLFERFRPAS